MYLNETRIEKVIDAYTDLINVQIDALKAVKDLHDYKKSIEEKTKIYQI